MTDHRHHPRAERGSDEPAIAERATGFSDLMDGVMATADRFGHRQHVHPTWLTVRRYGTATATDVITDGIQRTARYHGAPRRYNATVSRAWVELVGHHVDHSHTTEFDQFAQENLALLDKLLLSRFYEPSTLASDRARIGWIEPDRAPFPWQRD
jgi:hypothetical protein